MNSNRFTQALPERLILQKPAIPAFVLLHMTLPTSSLLVELKNLSFGYGDRVILNDITFGIPRGKDKAMLTLSVRDAEASDVEGRPMRIKGRTWDLITGGDMTIKEVREGRATYYLIPFEFLDREYRFFEFDFTPEGSDQTYSYKFKTQLWRQE